MDNDNSHDGDSCNKNVLGSDESSLHEGWWVAAQGFFNGLELFSNLESLGHLV